MKIIFYILIFALITFFVIPCNANDDDDACARLKNDFKRAKDPNKFSSKYSDVKECFESFPYDKKLAEDTIETLKKTLQGFYVFLSEAREEPKQGFSFEAIDIIKELDSLLLNNYKTDYQFMTDLTNLIERLRDAHLGFSSNCYSHFIYNQQLALYSVINNDKQIIKIFDDKLDSSTIDCEVTQIDGRSPIEVIKEFGDTLRISRDSGVRFNIALSGLKFDDSGKLLRLSDLPSFGLRNQLPEKSSIEYSIKCANDTSKKFTREWNILSPFYNAFNTSKDYWNTFCISNENITATKPIIYKETPKIYNLSESEMIHNSLSTKFFILNDNKTGVVVVQNVGLSDDDTIDQMFEIVNGFDLLENRGVKKLVFDFNWNLGGSIELGFFIVYLLFPEFRPSFDNDMVVTKLSREAFFQATSNSIYDHLVGMSSTPLSSNSSSSENIIRWAAETAYKVISITSIFDIFSYRNPITNEHFHTVEEFIGNNTYIRGGIPTQFTSKFVNRYSERIDKMIELLSGKFFKKYKWKNEDMIILTNGICGSTCSTITQRMSEMYNVSTVAVGGYTDTPLSFASFPGGEVANFDDLMSELNSTGLLQNEALSDLIPPLFRNRVTFTLTIKEGYDVFSQGVLEFEYNPAKYRVYYDESSARDPSILWLKVAKELLT
ncbi:hypothetical protein C1645_853239 [Glomus cerebriforme]|uniref:Tail specific protease domain-containing protein n=1 Tax=Glomus cerebriforme TaxID=658196 RepID=A0A397TH45_9GLOM|nr:hypothetical protein C1645_853239 [Glomus cerebriforme]